jgi:hypothetical protein
MEEKIADCPLGAKCEEVKFDAEKRPVLYRCPWYVRVRGVDTNTGEETDNWGCAIAWMPTLMINTANESRKGVAAIESFRNEMAKQKLMPLASSMAPPVSLLQEKEICD